MSTNIKHKSHFSKTLITLRKSKGLTQEELADSLGLPRHKIAYFETKAKNPTADSLHLLATFFNVSVDYFVSDIVSNKKPGPDSKLEQQLHRIKQLPRSQRKTVIAMLDGLLESCHAG